MATLQSSGLSLTSIRVGVLTVSDSCHSGTAKDSSGPNLCQLTQTLINNGVVAEQAIVPDEATDIKEKLLEWCDQKKLHVIFTTGGTGFAPRDITPEVTKSLIERDAPGLTIAMIKASLDVTPMAMLSRLTCGIRGSTVIINLPGSRKGSEECFRFVLPGLSHAVALLRGDKQEVTSTHKQVQAEPDVSKTTQTNESPATHGAMFIQGRSDIMPKEPVHRSYRGRRKASEDIHLGEPSPKKQQLDSQPELVHSARGRPTQSTLVTDAAGRNSSRAMPRTRAQRKLYSVSHPVSVIGATTSVCSDVPHNNLSVTEPTMETNVDKSNIECSAIYTASPLATVVISPNILQHPGESLGAESSEEVVITHTASVLEADMEDTEIYCDTDLEETGDFDNEELEVDADVNSNATVIGGEGMVIGDNGNDIQFCVGEGNDEEQSNDTIPAISTMPLSVQNEEITPHGLYEGNDSECAQILFEMSKSSQGHQQQAGTSTAEQDLAPSSAAIPEVVFDTNEAGKDDNDIDSTDDASGNKNNKGKRTFRVLSTKPKRHSKDAEVNFAQVGKSAKIWCQNHPLINGIYLNKGKREVKRNLVVLKRQPTAVDKGSYLRNGWINDKNRIDDYFEFTEEGKKRREQFEEGLARDEYVVNWYMWCPGHGNCLRKCGGYGKCIPDCPGSKHKQDRHNCTLMLTWKLYLSDLDKWRIQITGSHVPIESNVRWTLPVGKERLDEDTRDIILEYSNRHCLHSLTIKKLIEQRKKSVGGVVPSCNRINRFVENKRKRQSLRDQDIRTTIQREKLEGAVVNDSADKQEDVSESVAGHDSLVETSAGQIMDGSQDATGQDAASGNAGGYIVTYYDGTPVSAVFGSASDFLQSNMQTLSNDQSVPSVFNIPKHDSQVVDNILDQSSMGHMTNQSHVTFSSGSGICSVGGDDLGVMSVPVSHVTQDVIGPQHVHLVPQHVQPPLQSSSGSGVPVMGVDAEGLPCYGNFGDLTSFFVTCQQQSQGQTQT